jgi:hypothetical protein
LNVFGSDLLHGAGLYFYRVCVSCNRLRKNLYFVVSLCFRFFVFWTRKSGNTTNAKKRKYVTWNAKVWQILCVVFSPSFCRIFAFFISKMQSQTLSSLCVFAFRRRRSENYNMAKNRHHNLVYFEWIERHLIKWWRHCYNSNLSTFVLQKCGLC